MKLKRNARARESAVARDGARPAAGGSEVQQVRTPTRERVSAAGGLFARGIGVKLRKFRLAIRARAAARAGAQARSRPLPCGGRRGAAGARPGREGRTLCCGAAAVQSDSQCQIATFRCRRERPSPRTRLVNMAISRFFRLVNRNLLNISKGKDRCSNRSSGGGPLLTPNFRGNALGHECRSGAKGEAMARLPNLPKWSAPTSTWRSTGAAPRMRLESIRPGDDPHSAILTGDGALRLGDAERRGPAAPR